MPGGWQRTEWREIAPFDESRAALDACALRLSPEDVPDPARERFELDDEELERPLCPIFTLKPDAESARRESGLDGRQLEAVVSARDPDARSFRVLGRWALPEAPPEFAPGSMEPGSFSASGIDFVVSLVLGRDASPDGSRAHRGGSVIASRRFRVIRSSSLAALEIRYADFGERGWPEDAIWHVEFRETEEFDLPPGDVVSVWLNGKAPRLELVMKRWSREPGDLGILAKAARDLIGAEIYAEIATRVLQAAPRPREEGGAIEEGGRSLRQMVVSAMTDHAGKSEEEFREIARVDPARIRMAVQDMFGLGSRFGRRGPRTGTS